MIVGIETGGTTTRVAVCDGATVVHAATVPTTDPSGTLEAIAAALAGVGPITQVGLAAFGPLDLTRGALAATPKPGWSGVPIAERVAQITGAPVAIDTDVNAACLAEARWGAAAGWGDVVYVTIGTGVGAGVIHDGRPVHGLPHPEAGHVSVRRAAGDDFPGVCPFHGDCLEGLVASPAIVARMGAPAHTLDEQATRHLVSVLATPIADGLATLVYTCAPQRIVLGGGISQMTGLREAVRLALRARLAGYPGCAAHREDDFVVAPGLGGRAGISGALLLAGATEAPRWPDSATSAPPRG